MTNEELALALQQGDTSALEALWEQTKRLAFCTVRQYRPSVTVDLDDLLQAAFFGVRAAAFAYDPDRGTFAALLPFFIRRECRQALGLDRKTIATTSLDAPLNAETEDAIADLLADDSLPPMTENIEREELCRDVREAVGRLDERQAATVRGHWLEGRTLEQIARSLGVSTEGARQLEQRAFERLRRDRVLRTLYKPPERRAPQEPGTGLHAFMNTGSSAVERAALQREKRARRRQYLKHLRAFYADDAETAAFLLKAFDEENDA